MSNYLDAERRGRQILVPKSVDSDGVVGVGKVLLSPGDPDYDMWDKHLKSQRKGRSAAGKRVGRG